MALTDSFNAIYNKQEHLKQEKQKLKQHDENLEMTLLDNLQELQIDYITKNNKNMLLLPKTKHKLIKEVLQTHNISINKKSKYADITTQKTYLLKKYDAITNKTLRLAKTFDKIREEKEAETIQKQIETEGITEIQHTRTRKPFNWEGLTKILLYILITPLALFWGMFSWANKQNRRTRKWK